MDRLQFDALARLVSHRQSRRTALGALLGAMLLGHEPATAAAKGSRRGRASGQATAGTCYPGTRCTPGKGKNNAGCDFSGSSAFFARDVRGSNLSNANFTGADLRQADFRGATLSGSCFIGADLSGARLGASVNRHRAVFCNTVMPDGTIDDSGCDKGTPCCRACSDTDHCSIGESCCGGRCVPGECPPPGGGGTCERSGVACRAGVSFIVSCEGDGCSGSSGGRTSCMDARRCNTNGDCGPRQYCEMRLGSCCGPLRPPLMGLCAPTC